MSEVALETVDAATSKVLEEGSGTAWAAYPEYKDSGVGWLGNVPAHWEVKRADFVLSESKKAVAADLLDGKEVLHFSIPAVQETGGGFIEEGDNVESNKILINKPILLVSKLNPRKGTIVIARPDDTRMTIASSEFVPLDSTDVDLGYAFYLYSSETIRQRLAAVVQSATRSHQRANPSEIRKKYWAWPEKIEQTAIASFLDRETARIDALIAKKQQLIDLLQEKRTALISQAVTKGLDPGVPMKDSGVEWLGEIPAHWEAGVLKRFYGVVDCKHLTAEFVDDGLPLASIREVQSWNIDLSNAKKTTEEYYRLLIEGGRKPKAGDIIYSRNATVGHAALVPEGHDKFAMGQDVCLLKILSDGEPEFMLFQLRSKSVFAQLDLLMVGATFQRINVDNIRNFLVVWPPPEEQRNIVQFLKNKTCHVDRLVVKLQTSIELLKENRTALISTAVTGKIDVRQEG